jgi:hypothetical protein
VICFLTSRLLPPPIQESNFGYEVIQADFEERCNYASVNIES